MTGPCPVAVPDPALARTIFATADPNLVGASIERTVRTATGAGVASVRFVHASVGVVVGVELDDGRAVVVKALQPRWTESFVAAVRAAQDQLRHAGLPVPAPVGRPVAIVSAGGHPTGAIALVDRWLDDPGLDPAPGGFDDGRARTASARALAQVQRALASGLEEEHRRALATHPLRAPAGRLWPEPHNPIFDFSLDPEGASWIDELARTAVAIETEIGHGGGRPGPVAGHTDWAVRNVRILGGRLVALYDLDSIAVLPAAVIVGVAGCTWAATGAPGAPMLADPDQLAAFVADFETASGRALDGAERALLGAAALRHAAYAARLEHALAAAGLGDRHPPVATPILRESGRAYLTL